MEWHYYARKRVDWNFHIMEEEAMTFLINQLILAFFNFVNSRIDAYRILKHKEIAHAVNFITYGAFIGIVVWIARYDIGEIVYFSITGFFNRQISFDIPLNKRRNLPWYYQSTANPPKAIWDRIERKLFGMDYDGKKIVLWYSIFLFLFMFIKVVEPIWK
jgi:hypothetical protein